MKGALKVANKKIPTNDKLAAKIMRYLIINRTQNLKMAWLLHMNRCLTFIWKEPLMRL